MDLQSFRAFKISAIFGLAVVSSSIALHGQMGEPVAGSSASSAQQEETQPAKPAPSASTFAARSKAAKAAAVIPQNPQTPLTDREHALQMLNRFTFGPRPGEVEQVMAIGPQAWFEQQLVPAKIADNALDKRLQDFPTLFMSPAQIVQQLPNRGMVQQVAEGKRPYPTDPLEAGMYEVLVYKYNADLDSKKDPQPTPPTDDELAAKKKLDQSTAARVTGELFALPKNQRMLALMQMPVDDRIAFTGNGNAPNDQKNQLLADFTPRERELFYAMASNANASYVAAQELQQAKIVRAVLSQRQLQEVMTDFWFNHFNIDTRKDSDQWYTTAYERDAIRPNALGKFRDLLLATAKSPAMMVYLDNLNSIGPNSIANGGGNPNGKRGNRGLNENYAREVMELHTVSVRGGYSQADVTQLARILTGWGVDQPGQGGGFLFDPKKHEPGTKQWFGQTITDDGFNEGLRALNFLAASPKTAQFISQLLAQRFVADDPPQPLVDRMAQTLLASDGDIKAVLRTMVQSPEFNSRRYFRNKVKTPMEFVASTLRSTATDPSNPGALVRTLSDMGMPLYQALPPTGYYITADIWMNSTALIDRLNFALQLTTNKTGGIKFDAPKLLAMGLMSRPAGVVQPANFGLGSDAAPPHAVKISQNRSAPPVYISSGADEALNVLESTLVGSGVSQKTNELIRAQMELQPGTPAPAQNPTDMLNILTALVMGSPEFQLR